MVSADPADLKRQRQAKSSSVERKKAKQVKSSYRAPAPKPKVVSESEEEDEDEEDEEVQLDAEVESSDDELDQLENNNDMSVDDEESGEEEQIEDNGLPKQSSKEQHAEQKKVLNERKLQRKSGVEVQRIKQLWEKLRVKTPPVPKQVRDKLSDEIWSLAKNVITDLVMKHDASRVVQTLVKYSNRERRDAVVASLKGKYYELATSSYGKYLLVKLLHYGSKESRELILNELHGKLRKLMRHREGAYVVEDLYVLYATNKQKQQMIREFWGAEYAVFKDAGKDKDIVATCEESVEKRNLIASNLISTIQASVEKGSTGFQILHAAMREYTKIFKDKEVTEFIELLHEQIAELVHTPEGCEVACTLIAKANAKERKSIVRSLRDHADNLATNEFGNIVLITLFMTVDDTVLVSKTFSAVYAEKMHELVTQKFSRRPFIYILNGLDPHFFSPTVTKELVKYEQMSLQTSKKPQDQRRAELLKHFAPSFFTALIEHPYESLGENIGSQFMQELLMNSVESDDLKEKAIDQLIESLKGDIKEETHLVNKPFTPRLLRSLIQGGRWDAKQGKIVKLEGVSGVGHVFAVKLYEELFAEDEKNLEKWVKSPASFVIVSLFESFGKSEKKYTKQIKSLAKTIEIEADSNKGCQLLLKLF
ncbi:unnamed protein product [Kuraishia capsulata CBS 1993]|uniref:PUM-HD domain-containing protein n=1 Tax=Kuraishia capsulata CBS 1993 TaxID=1382522 RepID=W6MPJ0_9ASCO|nr:uncharacterized protein KUCA_T00004608001 [Kuraishia capsulata CBS 1993]CDK28624.1 unnamed protein product [Kuraishia capsulata CBS 1993]